jgi:hypothetical protein
MSWDEYKPKIIIYNEASTKTPAGKFLDMIYALKASKKFDLSKRLAKGLEAEVKSDKIINKAARYIETHFVENPIEQHDKAGDMVGCNQRCEGEMVIEEPGVKSTLCKVGSQKDGALKPKNKAITQSETLDDNEPEESAEEAYYEYQNQGKQHQNQSQNQECQEPAYQGLGNQQEHQLEYLRSA